MQNPQLAELVTKLDIKVVCCELDLNNKILSLLICPAKFRPSKKIIKDSRSKNTRLKAETAPGIRSSLPDYGG